MMDCKSTFDQCAALFQRMIDNSLMLAENGVMGSTETMLNKKTLPYLGDQIVKEMKWSRH